MRSSLVALLAFLFAVTVYAQQSNFVTLLGQLAPPHGEVFAFDTVFRYANVWGYADSTDGREYALIGTPLGTSIIDITEPATAAEVDFIPGPTSLWREIKTYRQYAYVVTEGRGAGEGVQIIDLSSLPDSAILVSTFVDTSFFHSSHTVSQAGAYLYLNGGSSKNGGIVIVSLANAVEPVVVGEYQERFIHDCYVRNDTIYGASIGEGSIEIIDATDKSNPQLITRFTYPFAFPHNVWTTEDGNYLLTTDENHPDEFGNGVGGHLRIWDIRDFGAIQQVADWMVKPDAIIHNVHVKGDSAFISYYTEGVRVLNIVNPRDPVEVGFYDTFSLPGVGFMGAWGVFPYFPSGNFIVSDTHKGLFIFRFDPATEVEQEQRNLPTAFSLYQNYPNPFNPSTVIRFDLPQESLVSLKVINVLGQEVETLVHELRSAGQYSVSYVTGDLPSGIYFYTLSAGPYSQTRKMVLVR